MSISARNRMEGRVSAVQAGEVMSLVTIQVGDQRLVAAVTNDGVKELGLRTNDPITAVVKSTEVMLIKGDTGKLKISARNRLSGRVTTIQRGEAMALVTVAAGGIKIGASITREALDEMHLTGDDPVTVVIKATEVMLMKQG